MAGPVAVVALGAVFIAWYLAGNELMRRRAHSLALWCREAAELSGQSPSTGPGQGLTILWLTNSAFRIDVQAPEPPLQAASFTGLVESLDVPMVWLWHRLRGRRDMVLLQLTLQRPPLRGLEVYRQPSLLAGDARHRVREQRWQETPLDGLQMAPAGAVTEEMARRLLGLLGAERPRLVRLSLRPQSPHLLLAVNLPRRDRPPPADFAALVRRLCTEAVS
jgi:hypothetical protein